MMSTTLSLGYSTCPNDTFIFHALAHGLVNCGDIRFEIQMKDVEALNQDAQKGLFDISKLSFAAIGHLRETYGLLHAGSALGRGCGPLLVTRKGRDLSALAEGRIAIPGAWTTANMLLGLFTADRCGQSSCTQATTGTRAAGASVLPVENSKTQLTLSGATGRQLLGNGPNARIVPMVFDRIMPAVQRGEVDYGVIIHEGRFTYEAYNLECLVDLGEWWEQKTSLPIPLGGIAVRRNLPIDIIRRIDAAIKESVMYAFDHPGAADAYIRKYAQEMEPAVIQQHIELYVNDFTINLGKEGAAAIATLFEMAERSGVLPQSKSPVFAYE